MTRILTPLVLVAVTGALAGCNGGNSLDDLFDRQGPGSVQDYAAFARTATFAVDGGGNATSTPTVSANAFATVNADVDTFRALEGLELIGTGTGADIDFDDDTPGDVIDDEQDFIELTKVNPVSTEGRIADPDSQDLSYHSYGAWATVDPAGGTGRMTSVVFGKPTDVDDVPVAGAATYNGQSAGVYANSSSGEVLLTASDMTAAVDFGAGTVAFSTTDTTVQDGLAGAFVARPGLNASGALAVSGNSFTGDVTTASGLAGRGNGFFFGDENEELGGTLFASDPDEAYTAGFGGKR